VIAESDPGQVKHSSVTETTNGSPEGAPTHPTQIEGGGGASELPSEAPAATKPATPNQGDGSAHLQVFQSMPNYFQTHDLEAANV